MRIASGFAAGMRMAETCGAVTGAIMVLGLARATVESTTAKLREPVYRAVKEFNAEFERRNRTLVCRDLLGCDIRTEEGMQAAKEARPLQNHLPQDGPGRRRDPGNDAIEKGTGPCLPVISVPGASSLRARCRSPGPVP